MERPDDGNASQVSGPGGIKTPVPAVVNAAGAGPQVILASVDVIVPFVMVIVAASAESTDIQGKRCRGDNEGTERSKKVG